MPKNQLKGTINQPSLKPLQDENVINITVPRSHSCSNPTKNEKNVCQTTINLFINEPHFKQINLKNVGNQDLDSKLSLGKNIPDHVLMKSLLDDLYIKKYSSAPNVKYSTFSKNRYNPESQTRILFRKTASHENASSTQILAEKMKAENNAINKLKHGGGNFALNPNGMRSQLIKDKYKKINLKNESFQEYCRKLKNQHNNLLEKLHSINFDEFFKEKSLCEKEWDQDEIVNPKKRCVKDIVLKFSEDPSKVCTVESHGNYENYRQNLVRLPDGTYCCKNTCNFQDNTEEIFSRSEIRRLITSDFIREKVRSFNDRLKEPPHITKYFDNNLFPTNYPRPRNIDIKKQSHVEKIYFPKETKTAMNRLFRETQNPKNRKRPEVITVSISNHDSNF